MPTKKLVKKTISSSIPSLDTDQVKTEFVFIASHQLRTPLTAIKLLVELLLSDPAVQMHTEQSAYLKNIAQSTNRMVQLVDDLLNVSRIETDTLRVVPVSTNLKQFVESVVSELEPIAKEKQCEIRFVCKEPSLVVSIDPGLMHVVLHNLLTNAIKYNKPGSCVVKVSLKKIKKAKGNFIQIRVTDQGIGIPKKEQKRIFQKFFRAENALSIQTDGSGLGLYIAEKIAKLSNVELGFASSKKGTIFSVNIPIAGSKQKLGTRLIRHAKLIP